MLVVILIVTILSVSLLPLLLPYVTESQYAAEGIPNIANFRTKIGVYVYDKGHLPYDTSVFDQDPHDTVLTWRQKDGENDVYEPGYFSFTEQPKAGRDTPMAVEKLPDATSMGGHISNLLDVDFQDLKGNRSKPVHYQYVAISTNTSSYAIGCFGDGNGLKAGTGYAVCELNFPDAGRKLIGTWKRYKSYNDKAGAIVFSHTADPDDETGKVIDCYIPNYSDVKDISTAEDVDDKIVAPMKNAGWEFN